MPKEITHWLLAERTAARLEGTRMGDAARRYPKVLKLGAIFPDLPYYLTGTGGLARQSQIVGNEYHGAHGEDTYTLLRTMLAGTMERASSTPELLAFLAGTACHLQADIAFHPLVYFMTGNYYDKDPSLRLRAIRNHRRLEGALDLYVCGGLAKARTFSARTLWNGLECQPGKLFDAASRDPKHPELRSILDQAAAKFLGAQGLFIRPALSWLVSLGTPVFSKETKALSALFYTGSLAKHVSRLSGTLDYRNPVSGQSFSSTVAGLLDRAVDGSAALCRRLESILESGDADAFTEPGPSLNFGIVGADVSQARHFANPPFFLK
ncbi:MAG: zinc dependent phospholipase C family protein [Lentisphaerota bacterium]